MTKEPMIARVGGSPSKNETVEDSPSPLKAPTGMSSGGVLAFTPPYIVD